MHILSPETDNCPSWISGRERMTVENISWSISTKECCWPRRGLNPRPPGLQSDGASNWATEAEESFHECNKQYKFNCGPAEPRYTKPMQTVTIQISWLLKKPTDLDLHCLLLRMWFYINNLDQVIRLAENLKWAWYFNLFSMAMFKYVFNSILTLSALQTKILFLKTV